MTLLSKYATDGLVEVTQGALCVTTEGRYFLRNIAMVFDAHLSAMQECGSPKHFEPCAPDGGRTHNLWLRRPTLYPLSYGRRASKYGHSA